MESEGEGAPRTDARDGRPELTTTVGESQTPGDDGFRAGLVDWLASCAGVRAAWRRKEDADSEASD